MFSAGLRSVSPRALYADLPVEPEESGTAVRSRRTAPHLSAPRARGGDVEVGMYRLRFCTTIEPLTMKVSLMHNAWIRAHGHAHLQNYSAARAVSRSATCVMSSGCPPGLRFTKLVRRRPEGIK